MRADPDRVYIGVDVKGQVTVVWVRGVGERDARIMVATRGGTVRTCFPFVPSRKFGSWIARHPELVEVTDVVKGRA